MQRLLSGRSRGARASAAAVTEPTGWAGGEAVAGVGGGGGGGSWKLAQFLLSGRNRCRYPRTARWSRVASDAGERTWAHLEMSACEVSRLEDAAREDGERLRKS